MSVELYDHQREALKVLRNGNILCGGVGSGKSRTAIAYYYIHNGGRLAPTFTPLINPKDLYIITTPRKRDTYEWEGELTPFLLTRNRELRKYDHEIVVDSWNNIAKYKDVKDAFFIFDEQRVVGYGAWSKAFIEISKHNEWILLSATPGDTWSDYIPVFIANGYYRNKSDFDKQHVIYSYRRNFRKIDRYIGTGKLLRQRNEILVNMDFERKTTSHHRYLSVDYNRDEYYLVTQNRWNFLTETPIENSAEFCYILRWIVNADPSRIEKVKEIVARRKRAIVFYNFDYELAILKDADYGPDVEVAEWNGHKHQPLPKGDTWLYLVHYAAGAEGWNCITADTMIFYSESYSYKMMAQASGRINRLNTPYTDLYYYHLRSQASIDRGIANALRRKKKFNEDGFMERCRQKGFKELAGQMEIE